MSCTSLEGRCLLARSRLINLKFSARCSEKKRYRTTSSTRNITEKKLRLWPERARRALSREVRGVPPEIMTLDEVAEFLRVSVDDLEEVATDLPAFEIGGQVRVRRSKLVQWVEARARTYARQRAETEVHGILAGLM